MAEFEWVVQVYGRKEPVEYDEAKLPVKDWGTICFNRKQTSLRGKSVMQPMTLKACVNIYRRFFQERINNRYYTPQPVRIYNVNTGEVIPTEAFG